MALKLVVVLSLLAASTLASIAPIDNSKKEDTSISDHVPQLKRDSSDPGLSSPGASNVSLSPIKNDSGTIAVTTLTETIPPVIQVGPNDTTTTTTLAPNTTTTSTTPTPTPSTPAPNSTTTAAPTTTTNKPAPSPPGPSPNTTTTTVAPSTSTTPGPNTTTSTTVKPQPPPPGPSPNTTTTTVAPTTSTTPGPNTTTSTTVKPPAPAPTPSSTPAPKPAPIPDRHFDGPSFIGGIVLALGMMSIGFVAWKFYKARHERNYHTL